MSHVPNTLPQQFPDASEQMHLLRLSDPHFARLADAYNDVNGAIHRAECDIEPTSDIRVVQMRKSRLHLLDEIAAYLV
ncbi:MAG: YdcH family protein [Pseudomonadota bacterium]